MHHDWVLGQDPQGMVPIMSNKLKIFGLRLWKCLHHKNMLTHSCECLHHKSKPGLCKEFHILYSNCIRLLNRPTIMENGIDVSIVYKN